VRWHGHRTERESGEAARGNRDEDAGRDCVTNHGGTSVLEMFRSPYVGVATRYERVRADLQRASIAC
jgi:hypothetical protein